MRRGLASPHSTKTAKRGFTQRAWHTHPGLWEDHGRKIWLTSEKSKDERTSLGGPEAEKQWYPRVSWEKPTFLLLRYPLVLVSWRLNILPREGADKGPYKKELLNNLKITGPQHKGISLPGTQGLGEGCKLTAEGQTISLVKRTAVYRYSERSLRHSQKWPCNRE